MKTAEGRPPHKTEPERERRREREGDRGGERELSLTVGNAKGARAGPDRVAEHVVEGVLL
jgi:hypothetical protein